MEVRPGYKQTEVGVIPEDWQVCRLGELGKLEMGKGLLKGDISSFGDFPAIPYTSLYTDLSEVVERENIKWFVDKNNASYVVNSPCVLLASSSNVSANTGKACALADGFPVAVGREVITLTTKQNVIFISYLLGTNAYRKKTLDSAKGITIKHVYPTTFVNYTIALPPAPEQSAIATALSDMDALLDGLDRLIAKKRAIKQATMQQLLTGQTRLQGFSEEWEVKTLGDIVERFVGGGTPSRANPEYWGDEIPWVTVKDFATFNPFQAQESITKLGLQNSATNLIPAGTLITSTRMALGKTVLYQVDVTINQDLKALFLKPEVNIYFLLHWFAYHGGRIDDIGSGSTVKGISVNELKRLEIIIPREAEQTAIATVLSDMDTEIVALETRRTKTRALKQAMMQELLTGSTRLV